MIELARVSKDYGRFRAVSDVSLSIGPGVVTGLLGPNGAGKSTLLRMITCLLAPTLGSASVCGHDTVTASGAARACIGYLPEFAPLYPEMTPETYLRYRAGLFGMRGSQAKAAVDRAIGRCWLTEMRTKRISALSKGYKQRVGLAAATLHDPKVVILDEPTTGLDPTQIRQTRELLRSLAKDRVLLLSSHILPEVEATCDRIVIMARGHVRADGSPGDLERSLGGQGSYVVEAAADTPPTAIESLRKRLAGMKGVDRIESQAAGEDARPTLRIIPQKNTADLREPIAREAAAAGVVLRELHRVQPSLEQVFMRVIAGDDVGRAA